MKNYNVFGESHILHIHSNYLNHSMLQAFNKVEVDTLLNSFEYVTKEEVKTNKTIFLISKNLSQEKLREVGFKICRDVMAADYIYFDSKEFINKINTVTGYIKSNEKNHYLTFNEKLDFDIFEKAKDNFTAKFISPEVLYPMLYKYVGDLELKKSIEDLLISKNQGNVVTAMEMMVNADWEQHPLYLIELINSYSSLMYNNAKSYFNSISFKGFVSYIEKKYETSFFAFALYVPSDYRPYCLIEEHHQYVFNKFKNSFEFAIKELCNEFKMKIITLETEVDKEAYNEEQTDES